MSGTEVVPRDIRAELAEKALYDTIDARKLLMAKSRMPGLNDVEVGAALELAASLNLSPWTGEFFAAKGDNGRVLCMVGRDGLLRKAEEFPDYTGYDSGVVYEGDHFLKGEPDAEGKTLRQRAGVEHTQGAPRADAVIIGAWAVAERRGRPPRYFFARYTEYATGKHARSPWGSTNSIMIEKVPISVVHRTLCNLSGVYLEEEVARARETGDAIRADEAPLAAGSAQALREFILELDQPVELRDRLADAVERLNVLSPNSWGLGRAQMTLPGRDAEGFLAEVESVEKQVRDAEARNASARQEEEVTDAVVVEDPPLEHPEEAGTAQPADRDDDGTLLCPVCDLPVEDHDADAMEQCQTIADGDAFDEENEAGS